MTDIALPYDSSIEGTPFPPCVKCGETVTNMEQVVVNPIVHVQCLAVVNRSRPIKRLSNRQSHVSRQADLNRANRLVSADDGTNPARTRLLEGKARRLRAKARERRKVIEALRQRYPGQKWSDDMSLTGVKKLLAAPLPTIWTRD
jgi:hypothetical protein